MGVAIVDLLEPTETTFDELKGKTLVVDSFNILYQFLTTIRQPDGTPLQNSKGNVTSHLTGLFTRTTNLMQKGLKLVFVFDGKTPELKKAEREKRADLKTEAAKKYEESKQEGDIDGMKKYASRTTRLTNEMIEEAKELLDALGVPWVQAPSEGEAQAAYMVNKGDAYGVVSQDIDSLLFGATRLIRNLTITQKRKVAGKLSYTSTKPQTISLSDTLNALQIDRKQLIVLAMLVGTDYNVGGVKGIGPKKGLQLVQKYGHDFTGLFKEVDWPFDTPWQEILQFFYDVPVTDDYKIRRGLPNDEKVKQLLVDKHEFSVERVENTLQKFAKEKQKRQQKGLQDFF